MTIHGSAFVLLINSPIMRPRKSAAGSKAGENVVKAGRGGLVDSEADIGEVADICFSLPRFGGAFLWASGRRFFSERIGGKLSP